MTTKEQRITQKVEMTNGGKGHLLKEMLLTDPEMGEHCRMFARVVLEPGCALGYHEHHGETETYYLLSGAGIYNDNGTPIKVQAGDVTFCQDGCGHGLENTGDTNLVFIALILKK